MATSDRIAALRAALEAQVAFAAVLDGAGEWSRSIRAGRVADMTGATGRTAATFEAALIAAGAGDEVGPDELRAFTDALTLLVADRATAADVDTWARAHAELLARDGFPVRASYLARSLTDEPSRRAAFAFAAGLAILRGTFTSAQSDAFELLADALDLPADVAETLVGGLERALH